MATVVEVANSMETGQAEACDLTLSSNTENNSQVCTDDIVKE